MLTPHENATIGGVLREATATNAAGAKAAHDTRVFRHAQQFFNNEIAIPTNGSDAAVDATQ